jgi:PAS domain-containing protein
VLILARDFASRLATPIFLVDIDDNLIYFNEAAEKMVGQPFVEGRMIPAGEWLRDVTLYDEDGAPLPQEQRPLQVALTNSTPDHKRVRLRVADGPDRTIEVTAFPLFAHADECVGAMSIFWEPAGAG